MWPIIDNIFNYQELSRRTLGRSWKKLNPEQQKEFTALFSRLLGNVYKQKGMHEQAIAALKRAAAVPGAPPECLASLGHGYGVAGMREEARKVLDEFRERSKRAYVPPSYFAMIHLGLDEVDQAFEWLDAHA